MPRYDAVIIGGGHNGLVASIVLARRGLRVAVLESRESVGGLASDVVIAGCRAPLGAYVLSLFKRRLMRELGLEGSLGLAPKEPGMTVILESGGAVRVWSSAERTSREFSRFSRLDGERYLEWSSFWARATAILDLLYSSRPASPAELAEDLRRVSGVPFIGERARRLVEDVIWAMAAPASRMLDEYFESWEVKTALVEDALIGDLVSPRTPGTALIMAHHYMGDATGVRGQWAYVRGGMGRLSEELARIARGLGVDVVLSTPVEEVVVRGGRVAGVRAGGRLFEASIVLSTVNVKKLLLELVDPGLIDRGLRRRVESLSSEGVSAKLLVVRRGLPRLRGEYRGLEDSIYGSSTIVAMSMEYVERAYADALSRGASREPWLSINVPSYLDPTIAPEGLHVISIYAQYFRRWGREWDVDDRVELYEAIRTAAGEVFEGLEEGVKGSLLMTPRDYEEGFGNPGGNIFHLSMTPDQVYYNRPLPQLSGYKTPIEGLYISGASTHPGGGVSGIPGYLASTRILVDLGLARERRVSLAEALKSLLRSVG